MKKLLLASALVASLTAPMAMTVQSKEKPHPTVKYRHHSMETIKDALIQLKMIVEGKGNAADYKVHARVMAANAEGFYAASKQKVPGGDTKQATWDNWDDFANRMDSFITDANMMAALPADASMKDRTMAFAKTVKSCKSCHDKYRSE